MWLPYWIILEKSTFETKMKIMYMTQKNSNVAQYGQINMHKTRMYMCFFSSRNTHFSNMKFNVIRNKDIISNFNVFRLLARL